MNIILLGAPGAGKGTVAAQLAEKHGLRSISTGDIFRCAIKDKTELGKQVKDIVASGALVSDSLTIALVKGRLAAGDFGAGFILDGFPRTVMQAEALYTWPDCPSIDTVVNFDIAKEELVERLSGRRICRNCGVTYHLLFKKPKTEGVCDNCGSRDLFQRSDDMPESIKERLRVYDEQTSPLIKFYEERKILRHLRAQGKPEVVFTGMEKLLGL